MEKIHLPFGEYVKQRRESLGMTMKEFAEQVKLSPAYLCDIEKGNRKPPEKYLEKFAEILKISRSYISRIETKALEFIREEFSSKY